MMVLNAVLPIIFGLVIGAAAAFVNSRIAINAIRKNDATAAKKARRLQMFVDLTALIAIVLLKNVLPFSYELSLVSAIIAMSVLTIVFLIVINRKS